MRWLATCALCATLATSVQAGPNPQLANSVAYRASLFGIDVHPSELTTAQAAALHTLFISERGYYRVRQRARAILRNPDFRD